MPSALSLSGLYNDIRHYIILPRARHFRFFVLKYNTKTITYIVMTVCNVIFGDFHGFLPGRTVHSSLYAEI